MRMPNKVKCLCDRMTHFAPEEVDLRILGNKSRV